MENPLEEETFDLFEMLQEIQISQENIVYRQIGIDRRLDLMQTKIDNLLEKYSFFAE